MSEFDHFESALNVQEGIEQPEQVSPYLHLRKKKSTYSATCRLLCARDFGGKSCDFKSSHYLD